MRPRRRRGRPRRRTTRSARSSTSGLVVTTTVVRPARASRRRAAIRASVCASTALVGSTSTSSSASASSARTSTSRWRWPPENERPRSSTRASSPSGSASSTSSAFATATRLEHRAVAARPHGSSSPRSGPEKRTGSASLTTIGGVRPSSGRSARRTPPSVTPPSSTKRPEPVGERGSLVRLRRDERREQAGLDDEPELVSASGTPAAARRGRRARRVRLDASTSSIRRAPTNARVILSTASAAVRSGMTRNAA